MTRYKLIFILRKSAGLVSNSCGPCCGEKCSLPLFQLTVNWQLIADHNE